MATKKKLPELCSLDDAVILALRCEYKNFKGHKPKSQYHFWKFVADFLTTCFRDTDDDEFYDTIHAVFDKNKAAMAKSYPAEYEALQQDEDLFDIYFAED